MSPLGIGICMDGASYVLKTRIIVWLSWIDDRISWGPDNIVNKYSKEINDRLFCDDVGEVKKYVGCKIVRYDEERSFNFMLPVLIQILNMSMIYLRRILRLRQRQALSYSKNIQRIKFTVKGTHILEVEC